MNIIRGVPPKGTVTSDTVVSVDIEIFNMVEPLHRPTGEFASMQIGVGDDVYMILDKEQLQEAWDSIQDAKHIVIQNALFDIRHLRRWITINERPVWDLMVVEQVLWGGYYGVGSFSLADMARRYLNIDMDKSTRDDFASGSRMTQDMYKYAARDAMVTLQVYHEQVKEIESRDGFDMRVYWEADEPSIWTILDMKPIKVNAQRWLEMAEEFAERGAALEEELDLNVYSSKRVIAYIEKATGLKLKNTRANTLLAFVHKYPILDKILMARMYRKATSTYGRKWVENFVEDGGLVYSNFYVNGTETGRFSSNAPNLLQIPARRIPEYRELFVNSKGRMVVADISQQEPRCLAFLSNDSHLKQAFVNEEDIHLFVTRKIFNDETIEKSDERRAVGKMINLATSYGMTAKGLADRLNIDDSEAQEFLNAYFSRFPDVDNYIRRQRSLAGRYEWVQTVMGRRVWMNKYNFQWENNAINAPIQGSSADFTKVWVNKFRRLCLDNGLDFPVSIVVYDEVVMDVEKENEKLYIKLLNDAFNYAAELLFPGMPFVMDVESGTSWACKSMNEDDIDDIEEEE